MRKISLSPEYNLPSNEDYNDVIEAMNDDIIEEGGASYFLATIRYGRRDSEGMHRKVVQPLAEQAFMYEDVNFGGRPPQTDLRMSRAVLSGMMFGHIANEGLHPRMYDADPYNNGAPVNIHYLEPAQKEVLSKALGTVGEERAVAFRMAAQAMSSLMTSGLSENSIDRLLEWGDEMVGEDRRHLFVTGFGTAMYLAWDAYSDIFQETGRENEIFTFPAFYTSVQSGS
jgi:hypothetical protein